MTGSCSPLTARPPNGGNINSSLISMFLDFLPATGRGRDGLRDACHRCSWSKDGPAANLLPGRVRSAMRLWPNCAPNLENAKWRFQRKQGSGRDGRRRLSGTPCWIRSGRTVIRVHLDEGEAKLPPHLCSVGAAGGPGRTWMADIASRRRTTSCSRPSIRSNDCGPAIIEQNPDLVLDQKCR